MPHISRAYIGFVVLSSVLLTTLLTVSSCNLLHDSSLRVGDWNSKYDKMVMCRYYIDSFGINSDIYTVDFNNMINLTNTPQIREYRPQWSPDAINIAFVSWENGNGDICIMNADGSGFVNLTNTSNYDEEISPLSPNCWSPDGIKISYIARESFREDANNDIYVMNSDGTDKINLSNTPTIDEQWVWWFPDSTRVSYVSSSELYVINSDGSNNIKLASGIGFRWSPDWNKIAFYSEESYTQGGIYVMDSDGSNLINVIDSSVVIGTETFEWSPDSSKIAFTRSYGDENDWEICVVNADGSDPIKLTDTPEITEYKPQWSPDGSQIVFQASTPTEEGVYMMDADGSNPRPLAVAVHPESFELGESQPPVFHSPVWAPDGTKIALQSTKLVSGTFVKDIHIIYSYGSNLINLTNFDQKDEIQEINLQVGWLPLQNKINQVEHSLQ